MITKLPKKWSIKITEENKEILGEWRDDGQVDNQVGKYLLSHYNEKVGYCIPFTNFPLFKDDYKEITFEEFRKFVLKKPIEQLEEEVMSKLSEIW